MGLLPQVNTFIMYALEQLDTHVFGGNGEFKFYMLTFNPYLTNGFSHHYHLDESTFIFRSVRIEFYF